MRAMARSDVKKAGAYVFEIMCRRPGTRINSIMTRIERGEDLKSIAARYNTDKSTIEVYQKALEGKLSRIRKVEDGKEPLFWNRDLRIMRRIPEDPEDWPWPEYDMTDKFSFDRAGLRRCLKERGMSMASFGRRAGFGDKFISELCTRDKLIGAFLYMVYSITGVDMIRENVAWPYERKSRKGDKRSEDV